MPAKTVQIDSLLTSASFSTINSSTINTFCSKMSLGSISEIQMMNPRFLRKRAVLVKEEVTYGVISDPTSVDAVFVEDFNFSIDYQYQENKKVTPYYSNVEKISPTQIADISFSIDISPFQKDGSTSPDQSNPPLYDIFLRASGLNKSLIRSSDLLYKPSTDSTSLTLYFYDDGILHKAVGCVCNSVFSLNAGEVAKLKVTIKGILLDAQIQALPTLSTVIPHSTVVDPDSVSFLLNSDVTDYNTDGTVVAGTPIFAKNLEFDFGNQISVNSLFYETKVVITDRKPVISYDSATTTSEDIDYYRTAKETLKDKTLYFKVNGKDYAFSFCCPLVSTSETSVTDMNGQRLLSVKAYPFPSGAGFDEFSIYLGV